MLRYDELTLTELESLPREQTVFALAMSPIEVHGPHLPVGTDVMIAEAVLELAARKLSETNPSLTFVSLPSLYLGADALPVPGSLGVSARALESILYGMGTGLAKQGFKYLLVTDNHGGPSHQVAVEAAVRKLWRRHSFHCIAPFVVIYKDMVSCSPELQEATGLGPGFIGDDTDSHAGTNETSLYLATVAQAKEERACVKAIPDVGGGFSTVPESRAPVHRGLPKGIACMGRIARRMGMNASAQDLDHIANTLAWVQDPEMRPYLGSPALASEDAGDKMLQYHVAVSVRLVAEALSGKPPHKRPLGWVLRFTRHFR